MTSGSSQVFPRLGEVVNSTSGERSNFAEQDVLLLSKLSVSKL
jgi:hypothetical protein